MMGGHGSGRWRGTKRTIVEHCLRLLIPRLKDCFHPGLRGKIEWNSGDGLEWQALGDPLSGLRLRYAVRGEALDYIVPLATTPTPWGARRWWFSCPACRRRCGALYLAPGWQGKFVCRLCGRLTYRSCQEEHRDDRVYRMLAGSMQATNPGLTPGDLRYLFDGAPLPPGGYFAREYTRVLEEHFANQPDRYAGYLDRAELCAQCGLTPGALDELAAARLLLPDRPSGKYRPKLAGWARKLAYLVGEGWEVEEIRAWAKGRWESKDPRAWPPVREEWAVR